MKKILIPTDFSDNSWNAIEYAVQLFKDETCTFHLLHTYTPTIFQYDYVSTGSAQYDMANAIKKSTDKQLEAFVDRITKKYNNPKHIYSTSSAFNTLIHEIDELYIGNMIDMIIMGTQGASGIKEVLFGSNTIHVIKNAKCPVIAVPSRFTFESPNEILFPSDYEVAFQDDYILPLVNIAKIYHSRVNILHVNYGDDFSKTQKKNRKKLETYFKNIAHLFHDVKNQTVQEAITNFQLKARINLLVLINNKHSFFENLFFKSTLNQIGFHLNIPMLVIYSRK